MAFIGIAINIWRDTLGAGGVFPPPPVGGGIEDRFGNVIFDRFGNPIQPRS